MTAIAAGDDSACAITLAGAVFCWGDNSVGELGNGSTVNSNVPVAVMGLSSGVKAVSVGTQYACAILMDGTVDCWGDNTSGELGNGTQMISLVPGPVTGLGGVTSSRTGWFAACAVSMGAVMCWGNNSYGELGNGGLTRAWPRYR